VFQFQDGQQIAALGTGAFWPCGRRLQQRSAGTRPHFPQQYFEFPVVGPPVTRQPAPGLVTDGLEAGACGAAGLVGRGACRALPELPVFVAAEGGVVDRGGQLAAFECPGLLQCRGERAVTPGALEVDAGGGQPQVFQVQQQALGVPRPGAQAAAAPAQVGLQGTAAEGEKVQPVEVVACKFEAQCGWGRQDRCLPGRRGGDSPRQFPRGLPRPITVAAWQRQGRQGEEKRGHWRSPAAVAAAI